MANRQPFAPDEWYHCFNRGVEKRITFEEPQDYERFLQLLYLCNSKLTIHRSDLNVNKPSTEEVCQIDRPAPTLVQIGAFCLMPNHFHLLIKEEDAGGITLFMRKLMTAYTMYFNIKNQRTGNLFVKPFRSKHIDEDRYFQTVVRYIHCNPAELYEPGWKQGKVRNRKGLEKKLAVYRYSSLPLFIETNHSYTPLIDPEIFDILESAPIRTMLREAEEYYRENAAELSR